MGTQGQRPAATRILVIWELFPTQETFNEDFIRTGLPLPRERTTGDGGMAGDPGKGT